MQCCCEAGDLKQAVKLIKNSKTDVNVRICDGQAAARFHRILHWASGMGHGEVVEALLARGVNTQKEASSIISFFGV